ncbi:MAG: hypothetical protein ACK5OX_05240 [Desertimonas sp.]
MVVAVIDADDPPLSPFRADLWSTGPDAGGRTLDVRLGIRVAADDADDADHAHLHSHPTISRSWISPGMRAPYP